MFGINTKIAQQQRERRIEQSQFDGIKEAAEQIQAQHDPIAERIAISAIASMRIAAMSIVLSTALIVTEGQGDIDPEDEMLPSEVLDNLTLEQVQEDDEEASGNDGWHGWTYAWWFWWSGRQRERRTAESRNEDASKYEASSLIFVFH